MDAKLKIKNILVATDFSNQSDYAISRAIDIAKKCNANITLLHVLEKESLDVYLDKLVKKLPPKGLWLTTKEARELQLQEKVKFLWRSGLPINYFIVPNGKPQNKILQYANKKNIDLLIMGAHGKYALRDTFVGTTAEYIAKHTKCSVLVVKNKPTQNYKKILVPTDFSNVSKRAFTYALKLFPSNAIDILHVGDNEFEDILYKNNVEISKSKIVEVRKAIYSYLENKLKKFIRGHRKPIKKHSIVFGYPGPAILNIIKKSQYDLTVLGTQGHARIHYLFMGSVANWILTESSSDVLLVPPQRR